MRKIVGTLAIVLPIALAIFMLARTDDNTVRAQEVGTPVFLPAVQFGNTMVPPDAPTDEANAGHDRRRTRTPSWLPTATPASTPGPMQTPSPTPVVTQAATLTSVPTMPSSPPGGISAPNWLDTSLAGEQGMSPAVFSKITADARTGAFDRQCTAAEHDATKWHSLLNYQAACHFDHHHGDSPFAVNDIFGPPGEAFRATGWEVAYPWQTFPIAADETNPNVAPAQGALLENDSKHEGYIWIVRRNQSCSGGRYCLTDFRLQIHFHGSNDAPTRWHSFSFEGRLCASVGQPNTCALYRLGGWADYARLYVPPQPVNGAVDCFLTYNGALEGKPGAQTYQQYILQLANYNQFFRPEVDELPNDELRCHKQIPASLVSQYPNGITNAAEWWGKSPFDFRWQFRLWNPDANVTTAGTAAAPNCAADSPSCRWTHSRFTAELDYVIPISSWMDRDGNGTTDFAGWVNRMGDSNRLCTAAGLNCIWADVSGIQRNPGGLGYNHDLTPNSSPWDYDITPPGRPSWITWFRHYGH